MQSIRETMAEEHSERKEKVRSKQYTTRASERASEWASLFLSCGELVTFHMRFLLRWPQVAVADLGILGAEGKKAWRAYGRVATMWVSVGEDSRGTVTAGCLSTIAQLRPDAKYWKNRTIRRSLLTLRLLIRKGMIECCVLFHESAYMCESFRACRLKYSYGAVCLRWFDVVFGRLLSIVNYAIRESYCNWKLRRVEVVMSM